MPNRENTIIDQQLNENQNPNRLKELKALGEEVNREYFEREIRGERDTSAFMSTSSQFQVAPVNWGDLGFKKASEKRNWSPHTLYSNPAFKAYNEQDTFNLVWDAIEGGRKMAAAGFLDMLSGYDIAEVTNLATGKGLKETGNWANQLATKYRDSAMENNTIYTYGDSMWNKAYWANQVQNLGYSVGIAGELMAEQALLTLATKLTGGAGAGLQAARISSLGSRVRRLMNLRSLATQGIMGISAGTREAYVNARHTLESTYQELLEKGLSEKEALQYAQEAAHMGFKVELGPMIMLNALQNIALFGKYMKPSKAFRNATGNMQIQQGYSDLASSALSKIIPQSKLNWVNKAVNFAIVNPLAEGVEEIIQETAGKYGAYHATKGTKHELEFNFWDTQTRDSFVGGILGGFALGGMAGLLNKVTSNSDTKAYYKKLEEELDNFINTAGTRLHTAVQEQMDLTRDFNQALSEAIADPNNRDKRQKALEARQKIIDADSNVTLSMALNALELDYLKGEGTNAYNTVIGEMQAMIKAIQNNDVEALQEMGVLDANGKEKFDGSLESLEKDLSKQVKDIENIKSKLESNLNNITSDFRIAFDITRNQFIKDSYNENISEIQESIDTVYDNSDQFNNLSEEGKRRFRLEHELEGLKQLREDAKSNKSAPLSKRDERRIKEIEDELKNLEEYNADDVGIVSEIPLDVRKSLIDGYYSQGSLRTAMDQETKKIEAKSSPAGIKRALRKRKEEELNKAKNADEATRILREAESLGVATENMRNKVAKLRKKEKIDRRLNKESKRNKDKEKRGADTTGQSPQENIVREDSETPDTSDTSDTSEVRENSAPPTPERTSILNFAAEQQQSNVQQETVEESAEDSVTKKLEEERDRILNTIQEKKKELENTIEETKEKLKSLAEKESGSQENISDIEQQKADIERSQEDFGSFEEAFNALEEGESVFGTITSDGTIGSIGSDQGSSSTDTEEFVKQGDAFVPIEDIGKSSKPDRDPTKVQRRYSPSDLDKNNKVDRVFRPKSKGTTSSGNAVQTPSETQEQIGEIGDSEYDDFVDSGEVSEERLIDIANKVKNQEELSERENAIFTNKTGEINRLIASVASSEQQNLNKLDSKKLAEIESRKAESRSSLMKSGSGYIIKYFDSEGNSTLLRGKTREEAYKKLDEAFNKETGVVDETSFEGEVQELNNQLQKLEERVKELDSKYKEVESIYEKRLKTLPKTSVETVIQKEEIAKENRRQRRQENKNTPITITYTPKGQRRQTYTIEGTKILNSKGREVYKKNSAHRRKIFANLAVKEGRAVTVQLEVETTNKKGDKVKETRTYIVNEKGKVLNEAGKFVAETSSSPLRKQIFELPEVKNLINKRKEENQVPETPPREIQQEDSNRTGNVPQQDSVQTTMFDTPEGVPDDLLSGRSPRQSPKREFPESQIEAARIAFELTQERLGREPSLKDFIEDFIKESTYAKVQAAFDTLTSLFIEVGGEVTDPKAVYDSIFNSRRALIEDILSTQEHKTTDKYFEDNDTVETSVSERTGKRKVFNPNQSNTPQIDSEAKTSSTADRRTSLGYPKASYKFLDSKRVGLTTWKVMSRGLVHEGILDNFYILDSDFIAELMENKTPLKVVPVDMDDLPVTDYLSDGSAINMTWGEYKDKYKDTMKEGDTQWTNKIPMVATYTRQGVNSEPIPLFLIQDPNWYNSKNISDRKGLEAQLEAIEEGFTKTSEIRKNVMEGKDHIIIDDTRFGSLDSLNQHEDQTPISLEEASKGTATVGIIRYENKVPVIYTGKGQRFKGILNGGDKVLLAQDRSGRPIFGNGHVVELRWAYNNKEGEPVYQVLKTLNKSPIAPEGPLRKNLDPTLVETNKYAVLTAILLNNSNNSNVRAAFEKEYNLTLSKAETIRRQIIKDTGIDLASNLNDYLRLTFRVGMINQNIESIVNNSNFEVGLTYLDNTYKKSNGELGTSPKVVTVYHKDSNNYDPKNSITFGGKVEDSEGVVRALLNDLDTVFNSEDGLFFKQSFNVSTTFLNREDIIITNINSEGNIETGSSRPMSQYVRENLNSSILSHEIETINGEKKVIIDVQPMIYIESDSTVSSIPNSETKSTETKSESKKVETFIEEVRKEYNKEQLKEIREAMKSMTKEERAIFRNILNRDTNYDNLESRFKLTEDHRAQIRDSDSGRISGLSVQQQAQVEASLKNKILSELRLTEEVTPRVIADIISESVDKYLYPLLEQKRSVLEKISQFPTLAHKVEGIATEIDLIENVILEQEKLISLDTENMGSVTKSLVRLLNAKLDEENIQEAGETENHSKSFLEKDLRLSYSSELKLIFFGLERKNKNKSPETNFTELPNYHNADRVQAMLADITSNMPSNWEAIIDKIKELGKIRQEPLYFQIADKLESLPPHLKNEFLYKNISKKLTIHKVINSPIYKKVGNNQVISGYRLELLDENGAKEDIRLNNYIRQSFLTSRFAQRDADLDTVLEVREAKRIQKALKRRMDKDEDLTVEELKNIFSYVGLEVFSDNTLKEYLRFNDPFARNNGILWFIERNLSNLIEKSNKLGPGEKIFLENPLNSIYYDANKALKILIDTEVMLNGSHVARSIKVNGKTMQGVIANTSFFDTLQDLKNPSESELFKSMKKDAITKDNYILYLLENDERFLEAFQASFSSPDSYKLHGKNNYGDTDFDKLVERDNMATVLGLYTNTKGQLELSNPKFKKGLNFRMGQMNIHTISDKGRMVYLNSAILDLKGNEITFNSNGEIILNDFVLDFMVEQLFLPEFDRILESYKQNRGVNNYDAASKLFLTLLSFNNIEVKGMNIHEYLDSYVEVTGEFKAEVIEQAKQKIVEYINSEVNQKLSVDGTKGQLVDLEMFIPKENMKETDLTQIRDINTEYVNEKPGYTELSKLRYTLSEYAINNLLHLNNVQKLFLGDLAFYSKDSSIFKKAYTDGVVDPTKISDPRIMGEILTEIGVILDKRTASLIAPGLKLANSENPLYKNSQDIVHIAMNDVEGISSSIRDIIISQYGEMSPKVAELYDSIAKLNEDINALYEAGVEDTTLLNSLLEERAKNSKDLQKLVPEIRDYFNIEGTDAQQYTTWRAHLDILYRQGNLTVEEKELLNSAYGKLSKGEEVSKEELEVVMQPIKPVYTGLVPEGDFVRPVYIKSSSFPLLPQLTRNLKIDKVRDKLEALEDKHGKVVTLSYQSANKIGSRDSSLTMEDMYFKDLDDITDKIESSFSVLPIKNFKIQQETPSGELESFLKGKDSYTNMGSQFFKILTGGGINSINEKIFPSEVFSPELLEMYDIKPNKKGLISGVELDRIFNKVYDEYSNLQKDMLYDELTLPKDLSFNELPTWRQNEILEKITELLKEEILSRGYPDYLEKSIKLIEDETSRMQTEMPMLFDGNTYRFEALLQAIISNRLIVHKLPGNQHIVGSSEGFEGVTDLESLSEEDRLGIVWFGDRSQEPLKATLSSSGDKIISSEVLIKSHFKLFNEDGSVTYIDLSSDEYSRPIYDESFNIVGREIRLDKLDPRLIEQFSFRIPTSSHQSGVMLQVVGFLPESSQDLIIVPKEHTIQLGEDYDIDKRTVYKSNYIVDKEGYIKKLDYEDIEAISEAVETVFKEDYTEIDSLMEAIFKEEYADIIFDSLEFLRELNPTIKAGDKIRLSRRAKNNIKLKMLENAIIDVHKSVFLSPNKDIQRKIFKPLNTKRASDTAEVIEKYLSEGVDMTNFSVFSDSYQRYLLKLGSDGKTGISIHSNAVTLEAQLQRLNKKDKVTVTFKDKKGNVKIQEHRIGGLVFQGKLGDRIMTLDGGREIAEVHGENQNTSMDNINLQIMGKRNENPHTLNVYAYMTHLGFDMSKDTINTGLLDENGEIIETKLQIPALFLSQPVLKDYIEILEKFNSITSDYVSKKEIDSLVLEELNKRYNFVEVKGKDSNKLNIQSILSESTYREKLASMSGQTLFNNLKPEIAKTDKFLQAAVLRKFFEFRDEAAALSEIQQLINLSSSKLGVSYFETLARIETLNKLPESIFRRATRLIGDYYLDSETKDGEISELEEEIAKYEDALNEATDDKTLDNLIELSEKAQHRLNELRESDEYSFSRQDLIDDGYVLIGDTWWKPTTREGRMLINSLKTSLDLMPIFFPYDSTDIKSIISNIFSSKQGDIGSRSDATLKWKYEIMRELNSFIASNIGVFHGDVDSMRNKLFFDSATNTSLAKIIDTLIRENHPILQNELLKDLVPVLGEIGDPSILTHVKTEGISLEGTSKYDSFLDLFYDNETSLGVFNGEIYTPEKLAQDLVAYSYLSNTENGAIGFKDFIPIEYLKTIGVTENFRNVLDAIKETGLGVLKYRFIDQYFQHNPQRAYVLSEEDVISLSGSKKNISTLLSFRLTNEKYKNLMENRDIGDLPTYVSIRNPKIKTSTKKWSLYKYNPETMSYERLDVLGTRGFNEYNLNAKKKHTELLVKKEQLFDRSKDGKLIYTQQETGKVVYVTQVEKVLPLDNGVIGILENFKKSPTLDENTRTFIDELIEFVNPDVKIVYEIPPKNTYGMYQKSTNTIFIHPDIYQFAIQDTNGNFTEAVKIVREVFFEEILHSMTARELDVFIESMDDNGNVTLVEGAPEFAKRLVALYETARELIPYDPNDISTYASKNIYEFVAGVFSSQDYRSKLEANNEGFMERFKRMLRSLFRLIYKNKTGEVLKYDQEVLSAVKDLLKTVRPSDTSNISESTIMDSLNNYRKILNSPVHVGTQTGRPSIRSDQSVAQTKTVRDLHGNAFEVTREEIITYNTDYGDINYIQNEEGDLIMVREYNDINSGRRRFPKIKKC